MKKWPIIDILIARDGDAYRVYATPGSWRVPALVKKPDLDDLQQFMWNCDAPYEVRPTVDGGAEIRAVGLSAFCLWQWLEDIVERSRA